MDMAKLNPNASERAQKRSAEVSMRPTRATTAKPKAATAAKKAVVSDVPLGIPPAAGQGYVARKAEAASRDLVFGMPKPKLSEAELRRAPEDDYMNKEQLNFFKFILLETRSQILANASDTGEHLRDNEVTTDPADRATQEEEYTLELRTRDRERKLLKKVERSLKMIDEGTYGWCEESGEPIGIPRLLARPTATLSLEAQERRERMQKLYG